MNITKHNCESWFLDYYEKTLSPVEVAEVLFFLEEYPELKDVFESYEAVFLEHEKVNFPDKESLKKKYSKEELDFILSSEITIHNCEQFFVASVENILSETQTGRLNEFLATHPQHKKDFELIQKCKLSPEKIAFEHKDLLKKGIISAENREEYFIRSIENDLNISEQKQLGLFLQNNPEYTKEFEAFKQTILPQEKISFEYKNQLRREEINAENREEFFVRAIENDLSASEQKQLAAFLQSNPAYKKEFELFKRTILVPEKISFQHKEELKRKERKPVFVSILSQQRTYYAAAAAILLLAGLFFFLNGRDDSAAYLASAKKANVKTEQENVTPLKKEEAPVLQESPSLGNNNKQASVRTNISVKKNPSVSQLEQKKENSPEFPVIVPETKTEDALMAKKAEEKKAEEAQAEAPAVAIIAPEKKDSVSVVAPSVSNEAVVSIKGGAKAEEYQTVASIVNKKLRSLLGIQKATDCEMSEKIGLWDLAMAAKRGVQRMIGEKTLDVQKVCDGNGENAEYVFTAGNFEISKSAAK